MCLLPLILDLTTRCLISVPTLVDFGLGRLYQLLLRGQHLGHKAPRVHQQPASAETTENAANLTESPIPLNLVANNVTEATVSPSQAIATLAESDIEAAPDLMRDISAGLESEAGDLASDFVSTGATPADSIMENAADDAVEISAEAALTDYVTQDLVEVAADLASKDTAPSNKFISDFAEDGPTSSVLGEPAQRLVGSSAGFTNDDSDPPSGHYSGSDCVPYHSQDLIEIEDLDTIEDSDEGGINSGYVQGLLSNYGIDIQEEDSSDIFTGVHLRNNERRTLPGRKSRDQGRFQQQRDNHVGFTIKVLQGLIDQVESRNAGEIGAIGGESIELLRSEIAASGATIALVGFLHTRTAEYRKDLLRTRRELKALEIQD